MSYPSTFLDVQTAVAAKLRLTLADDGPKIKAWINESYAQVALETRCFVQTSTTSMTAGSKTYALDASVLHIELVTVTQAGGLPGRPLVECSLDEILNFRAGQNAASGPARRYALVGLSQLEVWPTPAAADTLTVWYSYLPAPLVADGAFSLLTEPFGSKLLEYGALAQGAEWKRDIMVLGDYQQQYQAQLQAFQRYLNRKGGDYPEAFQTWTRTRPPLFTDRSTDVPDYNWA